MIFVLPKYQNIGVLNFDIDLVITQIGCLGHSTTFSVNIYILIMVSIDSIR